MIGTLYVCSTPIGNLEDASFRLVKTLTEVDLVACEDTRHTRKLLNHFQIKTSTISYHQHNQREKEELLIEALKAGKAIALVSDAGTPGISDPGYWLIRRAREEGIRVAVIPGPSALISALVVSGIDTQRFAFEGFLPSRAGQRRKHLRKLANEERTMVFFEAPHRLRAFLADVEQELGNREVAVIRELTKIYEEVIRGSVESVRQHYEQQRPRGEITVVVEGMKREPEPVDVEAVAREVMDLVEKGMEKKEALNLKAREYSVKKGILYNRIVEITKK